MQNNNTTFTFKNKHNDKHVDVKASSLIEALNILKITYNYPNGIGFKLYGIK